MGLFLWDNFWRLNRYSTGQQLTDFHLNNTYLGFWNCLLQVFLSTQKKHTLKSLCCCSEIQVCLDILYFFSGNQSQDARLHVNTFGECLFPENISKCRELISSLLSHLMAIHVLVLANMLGHTCLCFHLLVSLGLTTWKIAITTSIPNWGHIGDMFLFWLLLFLPLEFLEHANMGCMWQWCGVGVPKSQQQHIEWCIEQDRPGTPSLPYEHG